MVSIFFQWPIRIIPETILWYSIILLALFNRLQYHKQITAYQSLPPKKTQPNFMVSESKILHANVSLDEILRHNANPILH